MEWINRIWISLCYQNACAKLKVAGWEAMNITDPGRYDKLEQRMFYWADRYIKGE